MGQCFRIAADVNAGLVIHPGYFAWAEERGKAEQQLRRSLEDLTAFSDEHSVRFFIENMGNWDYFLLKTPEELPLIGTSAFALDVGHAHQMKCLDGFLMHRASHYHLHDNYGREDSHSAIGDGTIDFTAVMKTVRNSGIVPVIEVATFEGVVKSIAQTPGALRDFSQLPGAFRWQTGQTAVSGKASPQCFIGITHNVIGQPEPVAQSWKDFFEMPTVRKAPLSE